MYQNLVYIKTENADLGMCCERSFGIGIGHYQGRLAMSRFYINFYFKNIEYDDTFYGGVFSAPDADVYCEFLYDRRTKECHIWNDNKSVDDILPLPIWWLDRKLEQSGRLRQNESKISY